MASKKREFEKALASYAKARKQMYEFGKGAEPRYKLLAGNDNIIGDIGEYWVRKKYRNFNPVMAPKLNSPYAFEMDDPESPSKIIKVSVKTISYWSERGRGVRFKIRGNIEWKYLALVKLDYNLKTTRMVLVKISELRQNAKAEHLTVSWWPWLKDKDEYVNRYL